MTKTAIIGHRGAAGLALENTMEALSQAVSAGVKTVEIDVRVTADGSFVVCHDEHLGRISHSKSLIKNLTWAELQQIKLLNGQTVPLLSEVLDFARAQKLAVIVEIKIRHTLEAFCQLLDTYQDVAITVASFQHDTLALIRKMRPNYRLYLVENHWPIQVLQKARAMRAQGIDLNYMLINPLTYWLAKRWNMQIMLYTVDSPAIGKLITLLYPDIAICTNYPQRFLPQKRNGRARQAARKTA